MFLWLIILALCYAAMAFLIVVDRLADDMAYYWEHGEDYTPEMRADAIGGIAATAIFWPVAFAWRGLMWSVDRAAHWSAMRRYAKGGSEYVGRH